jgi:hypothetical protein
MLQEPGKPGASASADQVKNAPQVPSGTASSDIKSATSVGQQTLEVLANKNKNSGEEPKSSDSGDRQTHEVPASNKNGENSKSSVSRDAGQQTQEVLTDKPTHDNAALEDIAARSRDYLKKAKDKKISELEQGLGDDLLPYKVILTASKAQLAAPDLRDKAKKCPEDLGTIFSEADGRVKLTDIKVVLGQKKTWTFSFDSSTFECLGCQQHHNHLYFPRRGSGGRGSRQTIWLSDQSMPAAIPVSSSLGCIKIVRLENGSLMDLAEGLVDLLSGRQVTAGSVILLTSASNMLAAGTAGYAQDLVLAIQYLRRTLGDHLLYGPLPNILFNGAADEELIRTNLEVGAWVKHAFIHNDALCADSFKILEKSMLGRGRGGGLQTSYRCRLRLPSHQNNPAIHETWSSGDWNEFPNSVRPPKIAEETELYHSIIRDLRNNLALDLEPAPQIERWPLLVHQVKEKKKTMLVVGSSHASKTAGALERAGYDVELLFKPNWRALKNARRDMAQELATEICDKLEQKKTDTVVFQLLDSNVYWALQSDGSTISARSGPDNKYHYDGDLITISKSAQHSLFNNIKPIFEAVNGKDFLLVTPLPRYLVSGCCSDADHMPNRRLPGFEEQLVDDLEQVSTNFKAFLFTNGLKNGKVVNPLISLRGLQRNEAWGEDPVHPLECAYDKIAEGIVKVAANLEEAGKKRRRTDSLDGSRTSGTSGRVPPSYQPQYHQRSSGGGGRGGGGGGAKGWLPPNKDYRKRN